MTNNKRIISLALTALLIVSAVMAQDAGGRTGGGGSQKQNNLDVNSLRDSTGSEGLDKRNKMLKDIGDAVAGGNVSDDVYTALEYMSKEGLSNKTMRQGQLLNDYPTVRRQVAQQLGKIGGDKATEILILLCNNETNLDVQRETIRALGDIGINNNGETVKTIIYKLRGVNERPPDSDIERLLLAAVEAFDKMDKKKSILNSQYREVQEFLDNVSKNKRFPRRANQVSVDERARQVLEDILRKESQREQEN